MECNTELAMGETRRSADGSTLEDSRVCLIVVSKGGRRDDVSRPPGIMTAHQAITAACRFIDLMQAASLRAKHTAITAAEVFEMQDKDAQILRIAGELVLRL